MFLTHFWSTSQGLFRVANRKKKIQTHKYESIQKIHFNNKKQIKDLISIKNHGHLTTFSFFLIKTTKKQ